MGGSREGIPERPAAGWAPASPRECGARGAGAHADLAALARGRASEERLDGQAVAARVALRTHTARGKSARMSRLGEKEDEEVRRRVWRRPPPDPPPPY